MNGCSNGKFKPNDKITRKDMVIMLNRALQMKDGYSRRQVIEYGDISNESYSESIEILNFYNIIPNYGKVFNPDKEIDRLSAVNSLYNIMKVRGLLTDYNELTLEDYFDKVEWIKRKDIVSLSIYPTSILNEDVLGEDKSNHIENSFNLLVKKYGKDVEWVNKESLYLQYKCHVVFAKGDKVPWNIEPHRTETDYGKVIINSCNP